MSLSTITTIVCDGCGERIDGAATSSHGYMVASYDDAAAQAKQHGWIRKYGRAWQRTDLCPACQNKGKENHEPNA